MVAKRRVRMSDVRRGAKAVGSHYFDRGTMKFFGPEKFYGPYVGPGGTFFVKSGRKTGTKILPVDPSGSIGSSIEIGGHLDDIRAHARRLARPVKPVRSRVKRVKKTP